MTYPKTIISKRMRRAFMGFLFLLFFIISPLVLLYTAGYRYDTQNNIVLQTGVLSIDVEPDYATVYIGNTVVPDSIPLRITNVAPGSYPVRIEAEGYRTFYADLLVRSNETAFIRNLTLVAEHAPLPFLAVTSSPVSFSPSGQFAVSLSDELLTVQNLDTGEKQNEAVGANVFFSPFSDAYVEIVPNNLGSWRVKLQMLQANANASSEVLLPRASQELSWHWNKGARTPSIYVNVSNTVWRVENGRREEIGITTQPMWHVDDRGVLWQIVNDTVLQQVDHPEITLRIVPGVKEIVDISDERVLLAYSNTIRVYDRRTNQMHKISGVRKNMRYSPNKKLWLLTTGNELWEITDHGDIRLLERVSDSITSAFAISDSAYVVYSTSKSVVLLDTFFGLRYVLVDNIDTPFVHGSTENPKEILYSTTKQYYSIAIE